MRILVHPVNLEIGGSALNAVDLAARVRDLGHEVVIYAREGPLATRVREFGLPHIVARRRMVPHPTPGSLHELTRVTGELRPDLVHAYEPYSCVEAQVAGARHNVPVVGTLYSMTVDRWLPRAIPVIAGFRDAQPLLEAHGVLGAPLLEPPIDTDADVYDRVAGAAFRRDWGIREDEELVTLVSRLAVEDKFDSLMDGIAAVGRLAPARPIRLVVVGDGNARPAVERAAREVNERCGREIIVLTGAMLDPRPAYNAADVAIGMGTSILRAMSMERVAIVVGKNGYSNPVRPETAAPFFQQGYFGVGDRRDPQRLAALIAQALDLSPDDRASLGRFGRDIVLEGFSLERAGRWLESFYASALAGRRSRPVRESIASTVRLGRHLVALHTPANRWDSKRLAQWR